MCGGGDRLILAPLDLVAAHPWRRAAFTTYALSLSFFEAVLLDALVRGGSREALILADVEGVRVALSEQGARRVGKDYDVEPLAVRAGAFHPKISVLTAEDECHVLVGSGNLTFGGWGGNFEVIEHLHPSFAADAIGDAADFFDYLAVADHIRHGSGDRCAAIAEDLRASIRGSSPNGDIRLFHSLDGAISQKLAQVVDGLGGAVRLVAAAPFWDGGSAIDALCTALGVGEVFVHAHAGGSVEGTAGSNWPAHAVTTVQPMRLSVMNEDKPRRLHAKVFEVVCKRGRVLLSGSANATTAALGSNRNVEACVARIQREPSAGWTFSSCEPPELRIAPDENSEDDAKKSGVLRAILEGERIVGQILTPVMSGAVSVFQLTTEGAEELGEATVGPDATFSLDAPGLEVQSWKGGRLVLQVQSADGRRAEGFVSVAAFAEITRRAGALAPRLLAVLAGTETPADVAAIMSWFHEDPRRLAGAMPMRIGGGADEHEEENGLSRTIAVGELNSRYAVAANIGTESVGAASWRRFMEHVFAAFRERRGPLGRTTAGRKGEDDDDFDEAPESAPIDPAVARSLDVFEKLLAFLLSPENAQRHAILAFDLTQYICERLQPDFGIAEAWLDRLVYVLASVAPPADRREDIAAAILVLLACSSEPSRVRIARARLLRLGFSVSGGPPSSERVQGFQSVLIQTTGFAESWEAVKTVRTFAEQIRAYLCALKTGQPSTEYGDLPKAASEEWPVLADAFNSQESRRRIFVLEDWSTACPRCHMTLPGIEVSKLRTIGIATAKNCGHGILLYPRVRS
jgi:hypothetical protein